MTLSNGFTPDGDRSSASEFRSIVEAHAKTVRRRLRRLRVPERDLNDMCQEVLLVVHKKLDNGHDRASVSSLVNGVCVRIASTYHRSAYNRLRADVRDHPIEIASSGETSLDDVQRTIVILHDLDESAMSEVAETVGCPIQTAYSRLRAAYKTMRHRCRHTLL